MEENDVDAGTAAPYTQEEFENAEKEMNKLLVDSYKKKSNQNSVMFAKLSEVVKAGAKGLIKWGRSNSLWPAQFGLACCAMELFDFAASRIDADRKGYLIFRGTPRQNDVMIVAGWVTKSMAPRVKRLYEQMASPKYVIAFGECATSGGPWWESYNIIQGIDQILPVDVYVAGCPPKPENLFAAFMKLQEKIGGKVAGDRGRSIAPNIRENEKRV
ncbi:MAG: NADH-quinone oxidoreductase subunit NuoB [Candidatus Micrarchaeaceae archaeon]